MAHHTIVRLLIKLVPAFALAMLLWHVAGVAEVYHRMIVPPAGFFLSLFDGSGVIHGAHFKDGDLFVRLLVEGRRTGLTINLSDITSNEPVLVGLFLAAPIMPEVRRWSMWFGASLVALYVVHLFTIGTTVNAALLSNPQTARLLALGTVKGKFLVGYYDFYIQYGMFLVVLILWMPYIVIGVLRKRDAAAT